MQIVLKARPDHQDDLPRVVKSHFARLVESGGGGIEVSRVFPQGTPGNRGRMFTARVSEGADAGVVRSLLEALRGDPAIEYAAMAEEKKPM